MPTTSTDTPTGVPPTPPSGDPAPPRRRPTRWALGVVVALLVLGGGLVAVLATRGPDTTAVFDEARRGTAGTVAVPPGADIQSTIESHPAGTTFVLGPGVWSEQEIEPRDGDVIQGAGPETVIDGAATLTGWTDDGGTWSVGGQEQEGEVHGDCRPGAVRCDRPEELFVDGVRQRHVASLRDVEEGSWYFDYDADRIHVGTDPEGRTVATSSIPFAITGEATGVTVRDLTVTHYASIAQRGAIHAEGDDWVIEGITAVDNHALGVWFGGDRTVVRDLVARGNGQMGMGASGSTDAVVERVELDGNNTLGFNDEWEAGGAKFTLTDRMVFRDSFVHDNDGAGIWFDESARRSTIEGNRVVDNLGAGIFYEISVGATIVDNVVTGNGFGEDPLGWAWGSGIQIAASRDVVVADNQVTGNRNGIMVIQQDRGSGLYGTHVADDIEFTGNTVDPGDGFSGAVTDVEGSDLFERDIRFEGNTYDVAPGQTAFDWNDEDLDLAGWTALGFS